MDFAAAKAGNIANKEGRDDGPFTHPVEAMSKDEGKHDGDHRQGHVIGDFCHTKVGVPGAADGTHERFPWQHGNIGEGFKIHPKAKNDAAYKQKEHLLNIHRECDVFNHGSGQVDTIPKDDTEGNLQHMFQLEIAAQNDQLQNNHDHINSNGKFTEGEWEIQAQYVWHRRNWRGPEIGLSDNTDAERVDEHPDEKDNVTFDFVGRHCPKLLS